MITLPGRCLLVVAVRCVSRSAHAHEGYLAAVAEREQAFETELKRQEN